MKTILFSSSLQIPSCYSPSRLTRSLLNTVAVSIVRIHIYIIKLCTRIKSEITTRQSGSGPIVFSKKYIKKDTSGEEEVRGKKSYH